MFTGFATASIKQFGKKTNSSFKIQADTDANINADRDFIEKNYNSISTVWLSASITVVLMCAIF